MTKQGELILFLRGPVRTKGNGKTIKTIGGRGPKSRRIVVENDRTVEVERELIKRAKRVAPPEPIDGQVELSACMVVRLANKPAGPPGTRGLMLSGAERPRGYGKGDRGNYLKMLEDVLERAGFFHDDSDVVEGSVAKMYGEVEGWIIRLRPLTAAELVARAAAWRSLGGLV